MPSKEQPPDQSRPLYIKLDYLAVTVDYTDGVSIFHCCVRSCKQRRASNARGIDQEVFIPLQNEPVLFFLFCFSPIQKVREMGFGKEGCDVTVVII